MKIQIGSTSMVLLFFSLLVVGLFYVHGFSPAPGTPEEFDRIVLEAIPSSQMSVREVATFALYKVSDHFMVLAAGIIAIGMAFTTRKLVRD